MVPLEIRPLRTEDLDACAELLAARQRRLRGRRPELPERFSHADACRPLVAALAEHSSAHGVVACADGRRVGYLIGFGRTEPEWVRACWSPIEGMALADGVEAERIRDLYAAWAEHFVRHGYFRHYVHVPDDDPELLAAWVRTGFGQMQAHALRDLDLAAPRLAGVRLRRAVPADIDLLEPLLPLVAYQLVRPPAYAMRLPEAIPTYRDSWEEELAEPGARHWLAERDGRALATATFYDAEPGPMVPEGAWELALAMTLPEERGKGLVRALVATGFAAAREAGATHCVTDWRTASLPTHRSWTALGFRPTHHRLHRHIDERVAWAPSG
jgi:GNAT superfamily N-acetyltransferase